MINEQPAPTGVIASFRFAFSLPARLRKEVLGGLAVALALIPEVLSFSILAGLDPRVGLYSSVIMAMAIAFTGGRPAMISAAAGAVALVVAPLAHEYGHDYVVAAVLAAGIIQVLLAWVGIAKLMRFIPRSVMTGFVNALGIMMFTAQLPHLIDVPWMVYVLVAIGLAIMIILPRFTQAIPAPLVTIVVVSIIAVAAGWKVPDVADQGELPTTLPGLFIPDIPWNLETLQIIAPYAFGMALVGLMESLLTAKLVDDITDTHSDKTRESFGQGIGNILAAAIGGMGVCAMIGQTMIGVKVSQARTRLSTFLAGAFLLVLCLLFGEAVGRIPMAALVAVMILVAATTVNWHSIRPRTLKLMPLSEILVMLLTVAGTLATHNLAVGVVLGVVAASIGFARRVAHLVEVELVDGYTYVVHGQLFFASSNDLVYAFDYTLDTDFVVVDLSDAEVWDASTVATLDAVQKKYADRGIEVEFRGLDGASAQRLERLSGQLGD
ncbi:MULTISPECIES: SulP family inorganic anion transporter [unclassified Corynebacterium]|uniref:SulP family inorganic anion transporter n=1 Tax=Corynebacterium TaxID=1716 RepID=UPI002550EF8D|nr:MULTISPECIES: SulP family inorganic anion transporter [unclassified Corynebacterium]MDK8467955.1 SulP family inorganic anion transporter [Corynebacterium sp. MSK130]MDK8476995.1 SulP family inorganic anion transporter [Corynebacterium sp. MSK310]MDK8492391.1 SulP family inorganic anion transporter [Corynebacterium sp. MSK175]MDK8647834.1 SulP family inorganic anion transporter [Corynebacterium sp. MSK082]MDK8673221.1 SulP family inorganic anion transporter [Corynebacterium sp. MSK189]